MRRAARKIPAVRIVSAAAIAERLAAVYREIHRWAMRDAPICNDALEVEAIGFRDHGDFVVGVIVTPWFAAILAAPSASETLTPGAALSLRFPAGEVEFHVSALDGFGAIATCSLFSPMAEFADHEAARTAARAALDALFDPHLHDAPPAPGRSGLDRRALFGGRRKGDEEASAG
jgi:[NiFe] hydrogenase assembly HybE family chaperone